MEPRENPGMAEKKTEKLLTLKKKKTEEIVKKNEISKREEL